MHTDNAAMLSSEAAEEAAARRLRADGIDGISFGLMAVSGSFLVDTRTSPLWIVALWLIPAVAQILRQRVSDPRLGYVQPLATPRATRVDTRVWPLLAGVALVSVTLVAANLVVSSQSEALVAAAATAWPYRRFVVLTFGILAAVTYARAHVLGPTRWLRAAVALATAAFATWYWSSVETGLGAWLAIVGLVEMTRGAWLLWRVSRLPVATDGLDA